LTFERIYGMMRWLKNQSKEEIMEYGPCPICQTSQPVRLQPTEDGLRWILDEHEAYGQRCDGSGQMPETVIGREAEFALLLQRGDFCEA